MLSRPSLEQELTPRISVVMGVYDAEAFLEETLASVYAQSLHDWELIVVNDASVDNTAGILEKWAANDDRIRVITLSENKGLTHALIVACQAARGEYLARQDSGDLSLPHRLQRQASYLDQNPQVIAVGPGVRRIGPLGENLGDQVRNISPERLTRQFLETGKSIVHSGAMIRRTIFETAGGYRTQFRVAQDIDLWYRLTTLGMLAEIPEVLFCVRIDAMGITARSNAKQHALAAIARSSFQALQDGKSDAALMQEAARISDERKPGKVGKILLRKQEGEGNYFLGSELFRSRNANCRRYFLRSFVLRTHVCLSIGKYFLSLFTCGSIACTRQETDTTFPIQQESLL